MCFCFDFDTLFFFFFFDSHRKELELLASALLEKETLSGVEIKELIKFKESDIREPKDFIFEINRNNNTFSFNGKLYNNNKNKNNKKNNSNNNNNSSNNNSGGNSGNGGSSNKKSNDNTNDLKGFPETDLLNPQASMFIRKKANENPNSNENSNSNIEMIDNSIISNIDNIDSIGSN